MSSSKLKTTGVNLNLMKHNNFNFLRFYFAFVVVIGHLIEISGIQSFQKFAPFFKTYISVTSFFCISGYLITSSYLNTSSLKDYFKKRAARLLPAYIFVILVSAVFLSFLSTYPFSTYFTHPSFFKYLISNLTFLNFIQPCLPGVFQNDFTSCSVNGALWTLKIEVSFYLIIPILLYYLNKVKKKYCLLIVIYICSVAYRIFFEYLSTVQSNEFFTFLSRQLPGFMSYFVSGIALYYYFEVFIRNKNILLIFGLTIFIGERLMSLEILTPLALSIIVFYTAFSFKPLNSFAKKTDVSYGIYIFHYPIMKIASHYGLFEKYNPLVISILIIFCVLIISFLSWHIIEKQFLKKSHSTRAMK